MKQQRSQKGDKLLKDHGEYWFQSLNTVNTSQEDKGFKVELDTFGQVMYSVIKKSVADSSNKSPLSRKRLVSHVIRLCASLLCKVKYYHALNPSYQQSVLPSRNDMFLFYIKIVNLKMIFSLLYIMN